jgi:hypothetical protein
VQPRIYWGYQALGHKDAGAVIITFGHDLNDPLALERVRERSVIHDLEPSGGLIAIVDSEREPARAVIHQRRALQLAGHPHMLDAALVQELGHGVVVHRPASDAQPKKRTDSDDDDHYADYQPYPARTLQLEGTGGFHT